MIPVKMKFLAEEAMKTPVKLEEVNKKHRDL